MIDENEVEEIEKLKQKLINELEYIPTDGIDTFESTLLGDEAGLISFDEYLDRLQKTLKKCTCQASWIKHTLSIHCDDCQKSSNSCICVHCFLKGNHQGHKVSITHSSNGTCDCGDPLLWSPTGFCCDHPGPEENPELTQLDKDTRIKLIAVFKAAFYYYLDFASFNKKFFMNVTDWLIRLVSLGDATRRCVCIAMKDSFEFIDLYTHCLNFDKTEISKLLKFLGSLTNDSVFRTYFSLSFLRFLPKFIWINHRIALESTDPKETPLVSVNQLFGFTFHGTTTFIVQQLIRDSLLDWTKILNESLHLIIAYSFSQVSKKYNDNSRLFSAFVKVLSVFKSAFDVYGNQSPEIIKFVDNLAEIYISKEFSFPMTRIFGEKLNDPNKTQDVMFSIYFDMFHFVNKIASRQIYTTKPLELLKKFFDSSTFRSIDKEYVQPKKEKAKMNDEIIPIKYKNKIKLLQNEEEEDKNDKSDKIGKINFGKNSSFHYHCVLSPNVQFAQSFPTHTLAFQCLNLKDSKKTLRDYISEFTDDIDKFIKDWALLPLRWMAVSDLNEYQFFVRNSQDSIIAMHSFKFKKNIKFKFVSIFSLIQTLMNSTSDIDDFLLMIISTYGFFYQDYNGENDKDNNLDDNKRRLLLLTIFHYVSCLIFDTLCKERNFFTMRRLAVISRLMEGNLSLEEINSIWYSKILSDEKFCDDLQSFASRVSSKAGTKFHLTDSSEWHPLLPYLSLSSIIPLIQDFIHKNPDSLINFPKLPQENKHVLFSPTLWALEYHILTHKACKDYEIIHQLIFNVLIITSNNSEEFYKNSDEFGIDDDSILIADDFNDLVTKLKPLKFDQFLKKKIVYRHYKSASFNESFTNENALSLIEIISNLGNIGFTVLGRMNVSSIVSKSPSDDVLQNQERNRKNHERANKLKMEIMKNFNEKQKSFKSSQFDEQTENVQKFECSICHLENKKDCFVFPALIYKSPLSSYLKWRFRNATLINTNKDEQDVENSGNTKDFSDVPKSFDLFTTVRICMHPIHSHCIQKSNFTCPTDRCPRNASLPIISGIYDYNQITDESVLKGVEIFVKKAYFNDVKYAVLSLASEIEIIEMRHRSNPSCLDNVTTNATLRNIYLCIWHAMHQRAHKVLTEDEFRRRRKIIFNAIKNEFYGGEDQDSSWSALKKKLEMYCQFPEINKAKSIDFNTRNIMAILCPLKSKTALINGKLKTFKFPMPQPCSVLRSLVAELSSGSMQRHQNPSQENHQNPSQDQVNQENHQNQNQENQQNQQNNQNQNHENHQNQQNQQNNQNQNHENHQNNDHDENRENNDHDENRENNDDDENNNDDHSSSEEDDDDIDIDSDEIEFEPNQAFEDEENSDESEMEMFLDEKGQMSERKRIYLSPLMKYILFSMITDFLSPGTSINMESFITGKQHVDIISESDEELRGDLYFDEAESIFFNDTDTVKELSNDYKMLQFLRCAAIFDHFARGQAISQKEEIEEHDKKSIITKNDEFIDWDVILSPSSLNSHYKIFQNKKEDEDDNEHKVMLLPMFSFIDVPSNFLDFIHPPYSAPILTTDEGNLAICLLTGKTVLLPSEAQIASNTKHLKLETYLKENFKRSFAIFLYLNGNGASQVIIASLEFNLIMPLQPFYVDKFGDKDIGMKRGSLLYVSDSKREEIIDNFLSGAWTNSYKWSHA